LAKEDLRKYSIVAKLACAIDEIRTLAPDKVKPILGKGWKGEFLLLESPGKKNWMRSSYG